MLLVARNSWPHRFVPAHGRSSDKAASQSACPLPLHTRGRERLVRPLPFLAPFPAPFPFLFPVPLFPCCSLGEGPVQGRRMLSPPAVRHCRAGQEEALVPGCPGGLDSRHLQGAGRGQGRAAVFCCRFFTFCRQNIAIGCGRP